MLRTFGMMYVCFRPLIGGIISNPGDNMVISLDEIGFRPLIGVIISNQYLVVKVLYA